MSALNTEARWNLDRMRQPRSFDLERAIPATEQLDLVEGLSARPGTDSRGSENGKDHHRSNGGLASIQEAPQAVGTTCARSSNSSRVRCLRAISAITFDLDGTLINTADSIAFALNSALRLENIPAMPASEVKLHIGYGGTALVEAALGNAGVRPATDLIQRVQNTYLIEYAKRPPSSPQPYPGAIRILRRLRHLGVPLGICTNKFYTQAMALLHMHNMEHCFDCVVTPDTCGFRKPDPRVLLHALDKLHGAPERSLHIGDTHLDVRAARAAGVFAAFVTFGFGTLLGAPLQPDVLIEDLALLEDSLGRAGFFLANRATEPSRELMRKRGRAVRAVRRHETYGGNKC